MKKFLSLVLALILGLCALTPALAEEAASTQAASELPDINLPVLLADYQKAYEAVIAANAADCAVSWESVEQENGVVWIATINNSFTSLMLLTDGEYVAELACLMQSELSEDALLTFLSMGGYGGAALMLDEDTDAAAASEAFMNELFSIFSAMLSGESPENICGLPGGISISLVDESTYQYYFVLQLNASAAE